MSSQGLSVPPFGARGRGDVRGCDAGIARSASSNDGDCAGAFPVAGGIIAALVAGWDVCRLEKVLAKSFFYRVVRLPLLGMATAMALQKAQLLPYDPSLTGIARILRTPMNLEIVAGVMIASHFIFWNWKWGARVLASPSGERPTAPARMASSRLDDRLLRGGPCAQRSYGVKWRVTKAMVRWLTTA